MEEGTFSLKCRSVYPTATYTAHCSIVTGTYPDEHGIVGNSFYDKCSRKIIDFDVDDVNKYILSETLFERINGVKISVGEPITKGSNVVITKSEIQSKDIFEQDIYALNEAKSLIKRYSPLITIVNLPGVDSISEIFGPLSKELLSHLKLLDEMIGDLKTLLERIYNDFLVIILADHGMTSVKENIRLNEILEGLNVIICTSHRAAHIYATNKELKEATRRLENDKRFDVIIHGDSLKKYRLKNPRSGDLFVTAKEGYELGPKSLKGSHGGLSSDEIFVPLIVNKLEFADLLKEADITVIPRIVFRYFREMGVVQVVRGKLNQTDPAHGWSHTTRVLKLATELAIKYNADVEAVRISCLFHDAERGFRPENHEKRSASLAEKYLRESNASTSLIEKVKKIILNHHSDPDKLETIEEKILWDADKIDALGLIGLARCLMEAGFYKHTIREAIAHALNDLKSFKDKMHLKETKEIARLKASQMLKFLKELERELGKY